MSYFFIDNYDNMSYNKANKRKEVIIMKKFVSLLMSVVMLFGVVAGTGTTAFAGGWLDYAQDIALGEIYNDSCDPNDYKNNDNYYDVYIFEVPENGVVKINIECNDWNYRWNDYMIYSEKNIDKNLLYFYAIAQEYSSGRDVYYGQVDAKLSKGIYYLVVKYDWDPQTYHGTHDLKLTYKPSVPKPSQIKASKIARKSVKLSWSKAYGANGYQLQRKTGSGWKTIANTSSSAFNVKKLKSKTKYRFRVRAYKVVNGKKYYSAWSSTKTVVTKK